MDLSPSPSDAIVWTFPPQWNWDGYASTSSVDARIVPPDVAPLLNLLIFDLAQSFWRRLCRAKIQEFLTATIQNIAVLIRYARSPHPVAIAMPPIPNDPAIFTWSSRFDPNFGSGTSLGICLWISEL
jgi:hypothetical protein